MVTPKKKYTPEERIYARLGPLFIHQNYRRGTKRGIRLAVRYDPNIRGICLEYDDVLKFCEKNFFLLKLHHQQLEFGMMMLWRAKLPYQQLVELVEGAMKSYDSSLPHILFITIHKEENAEIIVEQAPPVDSMFEGLLDHLKIIDAFAGPDGELQKTEPSNTEGKMQDVMEVGMENDDMEVDTIDNNAENGKKESRKTVETELVPLRVCYDSMPTMPCVDTTVDTTHMDPYAAAFQRVYKMYGERVPLTDARQMVEIDGLRIQESWKNPGEAAEKLAKEAAEEDAADEEVPEDKQLPPEKLLYPLMYTAEHALLSAGHEWTIAAFRKGKWYTPPVYGGARNDPLRMMLLMLGVLEEAILDLQGLGMHEDILLISAAKGIFRGCVMGDRPEILYKYRRSRKPFAKTKANMKSGKEAAKKAETTSSKLSTHDYTEYTTTFEAKSSEPNPPKGPKTSMWRINDKF